jgi:hypothetical protein
VSKCGDACLSDSECVASVYGLNEENPYCWVLKNLDFGGFEDASSTLFVKVSSNGSNTPDRNSGGSSEGFRSRRREKVLVIPIVLSMTFLIGLLCLLLYYNVHRKRALKRAMENSLILEGAPLNFTYHDLQILTSNFSQLLGTGMHRVVEFLTTSLVGTVTMGLLFSLFCIFGLIIVAIETRKIRNKKDTTFDGYIDSSSHSGMAKMGWPRWWLSRPSSFFLFFFFLFLFLFFISF